jgi:2-dehydropantoate 2-reductase
VNRDPLPPARVAVLGPGGVGGLVAALLARRGDRVTCLAPSATAAELAANGLELRSQALGDARVAVEAATRLDHPVEVCFVTVKAGQLAAAVEAVPPEVLGEALVVPFLNGIDHVAWLRGRYPPDQVVAGTIRVESTRLGPTVVEHASPFAVVELATGKAPRNRVEELGRRPPRRRPRRHRRPRHRPPGRGSAGAVRLADRQLRRSGPVDRRPKAGSEPLTPTRSCPGAWR